jgi:hypothetical protein
MNNEEFGDVMGTIPNHSPSGRVTLSLVYQDGPCPLDHT